MAFLRRLLLNLVIFTSCCKLAVVSSSYDLGKELSQAIHGKVLYKGTEEYEKRRLIHNGLCTHIFPDLVVIPQKTEDVAAIVQITNKHNVHISVRSGGHSFTCTSTKQGGVHIDMRDMNRVSLYDDHLAILGPGSTWERVLKIIPPTHYTMIHGQCSTVGVGGYILGGGVNVVGTSERFGSAAEHVKRYTMVDAEGRILLVSKGNTTVVEPYTKKALYQMEDDYGLFEAMRGAGSSYGIVTEFLYKIYPKPETLPIIAMIYIETPYDLRKLEKAALDGRYHVSWFNVYSWTNIALSADVLNVYIGVKILPQLLKRISMMKVEPIFVHLVDNNSNVGRYTNRHMAMEFLKSFGIKLAKDDIFANILPSMFDLSDYESQYLTKEQYKKRGYQGVASANLMGLSSQHLLDDFVFNHPVFGLKNKNSAVAKKAGCDFCYLIVPSTMRREGVDEPILSLTRTGTYQVELTCSYPPNVGSRCPQVLHYAKEQFYRNAIKQGDRPTQYYNTPSCDKSQTAGEKYFSPGVYERLLATKWQWDPNNKFNHCQSVGNDDESCCPV